MTAEIAVQAEALKQDPLYLDRCQVDTPSRLVELVWQQVRSRRDVVGRVVEFGAGDGRFAKFGQFASYLGYELDASRFSTPQLADNARLVDKCAFTHTQQDADVCVGNPPYVRNQDLPLGWRQMASREVRQRTGVSLSGLANAWQYFLALSLASTSPDGLVVQVLPYEWVSRPSAEALRHYIREQGWDVDVFRLPDAVFAGVLTAASITVIDKRQTSSAWRYHTIGLDGFRQSRDSLADSAPAHLAYSKPHDSGPRARRGLSPGTQRVLTLTEGERAHQGLVVGRDVVRCVTSLRGLPLGVTTLDRAQFDRHYRDSGRRCWLLKVDQTPSAVLQSYLDAVPQSERNTSTCNSRETWWAFRMPSEAPSVLVSQAFKGHAPKIAVNIVGAHAVGGVAGVYEVGNAEISRVLSVLSAEQLSGRLVAYAKRMHKLEINQINSLLMEGLSGNAVNVNERA